MRDLEAMDNIVQANLDKLPNKADAEVVRNLKAEKVKADEVARKKKKKVMRQQAVESAKKKGEENERLLRRRSNQNPPRHPSCRGAKQERQHQRFHLSRKSL